MGAVLILPSIQGREPSEATLWMKEGCRNLWMLTWERVRRTYETEWFGWTALAGIVVILVVIVWDAELRLGGQLWQSIIR